MTLTTLDIVLPPAMATAARGAIAHLSAPRALPIDLASPRFHVRDHPLDESPIAALFGDNTVDEFPAESDSDDGEDADEQDFLDSLDPKNWKHQDHYRVLGLAHLRYKATADEIKAAHRKAVLKHHPDKLTAKLAAEGKSTANADALFKCIAKAYEVLSDPTRRHLFDCVDEGISDDIPTEAEVKAWWDSSEDHSEYFTKVDAIFERESRFSKKAKVPKIGDINSGKSAVEGFYNFWYNLDSTRTFEYLDDTDAADNRYNKRHQEQKNKAERQRRKNEDNTRLRQLVDRVLKCDERMKRFKEEDKAAKKSKGKPGSAASSGGGGAAKLAAEQAKAAAAAAAADSKAAAKAQKELVKKAKKALKQLDDVERLTKITEEVAAAGKEGGQDKAREVFAAALASVKA
ncbi:hypothetical protein BCR44DRAFT_1440095 [Catenaria anguillulae PL171]|uniref:J domain-containing protein n=1 Tax=Catenaria anguillulae PL171 TaxID=765915 RepID=A0A1Y2HEX1_9FUNG|nr:hypothetical protein BCR44DRAFT_1440095 [Catenaria anguillulae PL171]